MLGEIRALAREALADEEGMIRRLAKEVEKRETSNKKVDEIQLAKDMERIDALTKIITKLYEDMIAGRINEDNFNLMLAKAQKEQDALKEKVKAQKQEKTSSDTAEQTNREWLKLIKKYKDLDTLTPELLNRLIKSIEVSEEIHEDGTRDVSLEIHFNVKNIDTLASA